MHSPLVTAITATMAITPMTHAAMVGMIGIGIVVMIGGGGIRNGNLSAVNKDQVRQLATFRSHGR